MRVKVEIDRPTFEQALLDSEMNGPLANLNTLWIAAAKYYNQYKPVNFKEISFSQVMLRATEWGITVKTVAGRKGRPKSESKNETESHAADSPVATVTVTELVAPTALVDNPVCFVPIPEKHEGELTTVQKILAACHPLLRPTNTAGEALAKEIGEWDAMIAAGNGAFKDLLVKNGEDPAQLVSAMDSRPDREHLEAKGVAANPQIRTNLGLTV